jgi:acyl-CoA synthetase (AMP-forming)/AMP-acid ligase II
MPLMSHVELSPTLFLARAEQHFASRTAVLDGDRSFTYGELADRVRRAAGLLHELGIAPGDRVAALCTNSHVMLELHYAVASAGAVLVPLNIRLSVDEIAWMLGHSGARALVTTHELAEIGQEAAQPRGIQVLNAGPGSVYEQLLGSAAPRYIPCRDERGLLAISYTSGSTGRPKGVMYSHRGAYLQALAMVHHSGFGPGTVYLWTLPMFHCNGWACTWAVTAGGGKHLCLRRIDPGAIWDMICTRGVTHLSGAPTVLGMIAEAADGAPALRPERPIAAATGGAPPSPALLERLGRLSIVVTHYYGLTETYGPAVINEWQPEWSERPAEEQARLNARQGIANVITVALSVVDGEGAEVRADGTTVGEIVVRGNNVMLGYYGDEEATEAATVNGWFRTGDLGVRHSDGYVELRDRAKDVIISGGENIASVEIEQILCRHPSVLDVAVVGRPDPHWGEVPVAFVTRRDGARADPDELIEFVRVRTARFKVPKAVIFRELPRTSTGKVEKHRLRDELRATAQT